MGRSLFRVPMVVATVALVLWVGLCLVVIGIPASSSGAFQAFSSPVRSTLGRKSSARVTGAFSSTPRTLDAQPEVQRQGHRGLQLHRGLLLAAGALLPTAPGGE